MGGPSAPLTLNPDRRTIYGKSAATSSTTSCSCSIFRLNLSAEKRFTTSVPLQRLFFMNSDFMQQQAERLAKKIVNEPDNPARIRRPIG
jgi:hypothetical protein